MGKEEEEMKEKAGIWLKSLLISFIVTGLLLVILSFLLYKMRWSTDQIQIGIILVYVVSNIAGGHLLASRIGHQRFFWGILFALSYFIILLLISLAIRGNFMEDSTQTIKALILCITGGIVGSLF